jgi:hypothetical protein
LFGSIVGKLAVPDPYDSDLINTTIDEHYGTTYNENAGTMIKVYAHARDGLTATSSTILLYLECSGGKANVRTGSYSGTVIGTVNTPGITGLTQFRGPNGESSPTLYYLRNGSYISAGAHNWYYK